jgi:hypothetical protein
MLALDKDEVFAPHVQNDDPRVFAADLHRMSWGEYLELAENWKVQKRHQSRVWRGVLLAALVVVPLLVIGLRLYGVT